MSCLKLCGLKYWLTLFIRYTSDHNEGDVSGCVYLVCNALSSFQFYCKFSPEHPVLNVNWSMTKLTVNHQCLVFKAVSSPNVCWCFSSTPRSNPSGRFRVEVMCMCVWGVQQASIPGNRKRYYQARVLSILTDSKIISVSVTFFQLFVCIVSIL